MIKAVVVIPQKQDRDNITEVLSNHDDIRVLAGGKDAYDALKLVGSLKPDIVILDNNLQYIEGEEIPPLLKTRSPSTAAIILIAQINDYRLFKVASNQISGLVNKDTDILVLPSILRCVSDGGSYISPSLAPRILQLLAAINQKGFSAQNYFPPKPQTGYQGNDPTKYLTKTELQILTYIGDGFASGEIARRMDLTVGTIRNYISTVMRKTGLHNRSQMARYAFLHGLVPLNPDGETFLPIEKKMIFD
ncbi:MAG: response regulator transcription factor [Treponema sp.]|nr:response regulator transcription factor [Treponema sp.]